MKNHYSDQLKSQRLTTRFITKSDAQTWCDFVSHKEATEFFPDFYAPNDPLPMAEKFLEKQFIRYKEKRYGLQALITKENGKFIGLCGLLDQTIDNQQELEIGYHILPQYWNMGYATEAAKTFMNFAKENALGHSLISIIDVENSKSQRVAEKNGFTKENRTNYQGYDVWIYRISLD